MCRPGRADAAVVVPERFPLPGLLRPAHEALLHVLVEDLLLEEGPHLCKQGSSSDHVSFGVSESPKRWPKSYGKYWLTARHLGDNCIQRQGAVAAEELDDGPAKLTS